MLTARLPGGGLVRSEVKGGRGGWIVMCHGVIVKMRSRKGRRGRPLYEDKVEMRLGEVEERGGTAASTRQAAHERRDA